MSNLRKGYKKEWTIGKLIVRIEYLSSGLTRYFLNDAEVDFIDVSCDYGTYPHEYRVSIIPGNDRHQAFFPTGFCQLPIEDKS